MAQLVETATDYRHTHKDLGLLMVNVYGFVFHESSMLPKIKVKGHMVQKLERPWTDGRTLPNVLSPLLRGQ